MINITRNEKILLFLSFIIPTILFTNYILNHIYHYGSGVLDVGWFVFLTSNNLSWPLQNPNLEILTESFFSTHFSPFFYLPSSIYQISNSIISPHMLFALFMGSMSGVISLSINLAFIKLISNKSIIMLVVILFLSILGSLNGASLALIGFPHIEIAIPALIMLFVVLYFSDYKKLSYLIFILLLTIREDAGFHLFGLLFIIIAINGLTKKNLAQINKDLWIILFVAFIYSVIAILLQKTFFPGDSAITRIFLGEPTFNHVTKDFIVHNIMFFFSYREYLYIPAIITIAFTIYTRNFYLLSALLSIIPWSLLLFFAIASMTNTFSCYYIFPFIVMLCWPVFGFLIFQYFNKHKTKSNILILSYVFITLSSLILYNGFNNLDNKPYAKMNFNYINSYNNIENAKQIFIENKNSFGKILFDEPSACIFIKSLNTGQYGFMNNFSNEQKDNVNTVVFFNNHDTLNPLGLTIMKEIIYKNKLTNIFAVKNSNLMIATNKNSDIFKQNIFAKVDCNSFLNTIVRLRANELPTQIGKIQNSSIAVNNKEKGFITYGPYVKLPAGKYQFDIAYISSEANVSTVGYWDVGIALPNEYKVLDKGNIIGTDSNKSHIIQTFVIPQEYNNKKIEVRNFYDGAGKLTIESLAIIKIE